MKKQFINNLGLLLLVIIMISVIPVSAQSRFSLKDATGESAFRLGIRNMIQTTDRSFEFDIYMVDTEPTSKFELATIQAGILINSVIFANGTPTISLVQESSTLNSRQTPEVIGFVDEVRGHSGVSLIKLASRGAAGRGNGTIISGEGSGDCITRIRITNSIPFEVNSNANMVFTSGTVLNPFYATRVAQYISSLNVQLAVIPGENVLVNENLTLNPTHDALGVNTFSDDNPLNIRIYSFDKTIAIENPANHTGEISIFDLSGRELLSSMLSAQSRTLIPIQSNSGTYIVKVHTTIGSLNTKVFIR